MKSKRTHRQIISRAHFLDIKFDNFYYTTEQDAIIRKYYLEDIEKCCKLIPHKTLEQIKVHALKLGIITTPKWTKEEEDILIDNYASIGGSGCKKLLNNRELSAIHAKAEKLGLKYSYNPNNWTEEDDNYLKVNYPLEGSKAIKELLKTGKYSENSIKTRIQTLGLKKLTKYKASKKIICVETGKIYNSSREAAELLNLNYGSLGNACKNGRAVGGYHWRYVDE